MSTMAENTKGAPQISRVTAVAQLIAGRDAYRDGKDVAACPHSPTGDVDERFAAHWWRKGFALAKMDDES